MFKFTKCDFCPVPEYYSKYYSIPYTYTDEVGISPLDCEFLLENILEYREKIMSKGIEKVKKDHAKSQIDRIFWVFEQFGIPKEAVNDAIPIHNRRRLLYSLIYMSRERD